MRTIFRFVAAGGLLLVAGTTRAENLHDFLQRVEAESAAASPLRGDGTIETVTDGAVGDGASKADKIVVALRPPADTFVELQKDGTRLLLLEGGARSLRSLKGTNAETVSGDASLANSDFTCEDFQPFRVSRFADMRISDDSGGELTAALFPTKSQYSLLEMTFDRDKKVPIKTIFYRDTLNNAVKMARYGGYQQIAGKWLPTTISMESFRLKTRTTLTLRWTSPPQLPSSLFEADSLGRPSQMDWPSSAPAPGP